MSRKVTLLQLRDRARQRADAENDSGWVSDAELTSYVNESYTWVYELLVKSGESWFESTQTIATVSGTVTYDLPNDFYATIGVSRVDGSTLRSIPNFMAAERNRYFNMQGGTPIAYRIVGQSIELLPTAGGVHSIQHRYVPTPVNLAFDTDTLDGVMGWEELVILNVAIKMGIKEESNVEPLVLAQQMFLDRLSEMVENRELAESHTIFDVEEPDTIQSESSFFPWQRG